MRCNFCRVVGWERLGWPLVTLGFRKITNCDGEIAGTEGKMRAREQQKESQVENGSQARHCHNHGHVRQPTWLLSFSFPYFCTHISPPPFLISIGNISWDWRGPRKLERSPFTREHQLEKILLLQRLFPPNCHGIQKIYPVGSIVFHHLWFWNAL